MNDSFSMIFSVATKVVQFIRKQTKKKSRDQDNVWSCSVNPNITGGEMPLESVGWEDLWIKTELLYNNWGQDEFSTVDLFHAKMLGGFGNLVGKLYPEWNLNITYSSSALDGNANWGFMNACVFFESLL